MYPKNLKIPQELRPLNHLRPLKLVIMIAMVTMALMGLVACQPIQALPKAKAASTTSVLSSDEVANKAVIQRFYEEVVNQKHMDALGELFDANLVIHDLDYGADNTGDLGEMLLTGLPDVKVTISLWVVQDDLVTAVATYRGTHTGEFIGVAPTGNPVTFSLIDIFRVKDGKAIELWHNVPVADEMEQIQPESAVKAVQQTERTDDTYFPSR